MIGNEELRTIVVAEALNKVVAAISTLTLKERRRVLKSAKEVTHTYDNTRVHRR